MPDLSRIIDASTVALMPREPALIYPAIAAELNRTGAKNITGIITDEARMEVYMIDNVPTLERAIHLTLKGAFESAAMKNSIGTPSVWVATDAADIKQNSQDAVIMNMILDPKKQDNATRLVALAASELKEGGELIIVRPNAPYAFLDDILKKFNFAVQTAKNIGGEELLLSVCKFTPPPFPKQSGDGTIGGFFLSFIKPN